LSKRMNRGAVSPATRNAARAQRPPQKNVQLTHTALTPRTVRTQASARRRADGGGGSPAGHARVPRGRLRLRADAFATGLAATCGKRAAAVPLEGRRPALDQPARLPQGQPEFQLERRRGDLRRNLQQPCAPTCLSFSLCAGSRTALLATGRPHLTLFSDALLCAGAPADPARWVAGRWKAPWEQPTARKPSQPRAGGAAAAAAEARPATATARLAESSRVSLEEYARFFEVQTGAPPTPRVLDAFVASQALSATTAWASQSGGGDSSRTPPTTAKQRRNQRLQESIEAGVRFKEPYPRPPREPTGQDPRGGAAHMMFATRYYYVPPAASSCCPSDPTAFSCCLIRLICLG
jgi:hypothetical protein